MGAFGLDFDLDIRTTGRASKPLSVEYVRDLNEGDIALLATERSIKAPTVTKLRDSHHALAKYLSTGMSPEHASLITGYSLSRIYVLQSQDESFKELVSFYQSNREEIFADLTERMSMLSLEAEALLRERLHDEPESFSPGMLLEIIKTLADRTGHGPSSKSTVVNLNVDLAGRLERARARVKEIS